MQQGSLPFNSFSHSLTSGKVPTLLTAIIFHNRRVYGTLFEEIINSGFAKCKEDKC
jgi:hypothetical protein